MVDLLIGGVGIADRDALKDSIEDAVLNCRSAAQNGVGYGANYEGFKVYNELSRDFETQLKYLEEKLNEENISEDEKLDYNKRKYNYLIKAAVAKIILTAYTRLVVNVYLPFCNDKVADATKIALYSIGAKNEEERTPFNIITQKFDGKVLTSIKTESSMLYAIKKIITLLFNTNQFIVPDPRFNIYEMNDESFTTTIDTTIKDEDEKENVEEPDISSKEGSDESDTNESSETGAEN
jgi:hypothetical protein